MSAITKVLQTFELLEAILLQAETYEICLATAVCTHWRAVVENSLALRTYILTLPVRRPGPDRPGFDQGAFCRLHSSVNAMWHFSVKTADKGALYIMRLPSEGVEVFLFAPRRKDGYLKVLDNAYDMYAVTTDFRPDLEFRTKTGQKVCRTKCKALRVIHPKHMQILRRSDNHGVVCGQLLGATSPPSMPMSMDRE